MAVVFATAIQFLLIGVKIDKNNSQMSLMAAGMWI
jgi:hypothetical protein